MSKTWLAVVFAVVALAQVPLTPRQVTIKYLVGPPQRSMLTLSDLTWEGQYKVASAGSAGTCEAANGVGGSTSSAQQALAVRYVGAGKVNRRYYGLTFCVNGGHTGRSWGDLVEYQDNASALDTGSDPTAAPALVETRRWAQWTNYDSWMASLQDTNNGVNMMSIYWDDVHSVMWWLVAGAYTGFNMPFLGATQLLDTCDATNSMDCGGSSALHYKNVGSIYGPWYYQTTTSMDVYWKAVNQGIVPIPGTAQADFGGRTVLLTGTVGAVGGTGHLGPGMRAFKQLPTLGSSHFVIYPASDVSGGTDKVGLQIADYTTTYCDATTPHAHRDTNYVPVIHPEHYLGFTGLYPPSGAVGYWQMSIDNTSGFAWVETPTRQGIISFGRLAHGTGANQGTSYTSANPLNNAFDGCPNITSVGTVATMVCTADATAHKANTAHVNVGTLVTTGCASPSAYNVTGATVTAVDTTNDTFSYTITDVGNVTASYDGSAPNGTICAGLGEIGRKAWRSDESYSDPTRAAMDSTNGYFSSAYDAALIAFDPVQVRQSALGQRDYCNTDFHAGPFANTGGTNPSNLGDWHAQFPNIHLNVDDNGWDGTATHSRKQTYQASQGLFFDAKQNELIWMFGESNSTATTPSAAPPMLHFFSVTSS